jgi:hypothetical protein
MRVNSNSVSQIHLVKRLPAENQLFIVCPFSKIENQFYSKNECIPFFITRLGACTDSMDLSTQHALLHFIKEQNILQITLAVSTECAFMDRIISRKKLFGLAPEKTMEDIYIDHYNKTFKFLDTKEQKIELARLYAADQLNSFKNLTFLKQFLNQSNISFNIMIVEEGQHFITQTLNQSAENQVYFSEYSQV